jgi:hypothetical protein
MPAARQGTTPVTQLIEKSILDEALRVGVDGVTKANKYMQINRKLVDAIRDSLAKIETGRITEGRDGLRKALADVARSLVS